MIRLADGTEIQKGECGYAGGSMWCWIQDMTFQDAVLLFSDREKTAQIRDVHENYTMVYTGFTVLDAIRRTEFLPGQYTTDIRLTGDGKEDINVHQEVNDLDGSSNV